MPLLFRGTTTIRWGWISLEGGEGLEFAEGMSAFVRLVGVWVLMSASVGAAERIWHVKAVHPEGRLLDVKAIDKEGQIHSVKAIQDGDNFHLLDIKALQGKERLPVKVLVSTDKNLPVKAIASDGTILDVKALTAEGQKLDVKGVRRSGSIIHIKALGPGGAEYGVKAISPEGRMYDIKGIKMSAEKEEGKVNGVAFGAHVKALPQAGN